MNQEKPNSFHKEPTISACMIVKNEEKLLAQCLDSIKDIMDEIIIVDTGSTDNTIEIAKRYTDKIYFHEWKNSFSEARNHSIKYAQCDWILIIDADEKLEQEDKRLLKVVLRDDRFNSIYFAILSDLPTGVSKHYSQRVFRNGKGYYDGIVHNQLICEGASVMTDIRIYHYGYNLNSEQMQKKFKRTETLLKKQVQENPNYIFGWMNLVRIYKCQELWDDALKTAEDVINTKREIIDDTTYQMIVYDMIYSIFSKKDYDRAEKLCAEILESYPNNLDINFLRGSINICKNNYQKAIRNYMQYLRISEEGLGLSEYPNIIVDTFSSQGQAWNNIGSAYAEISQPDKAIDAYKKAISYKNDPMYYENLARIYFKQNMIKEMTTTLEEADSLNIATNIMLLQLSEIYSKQKDFDKAINYLQRVVDIEPSKPENLIKIAHLFMLKNEHEKAKSIFEDVFNLGIRNHEILHNLAIINTRLNLKDKTDQYIEEIMKTDDIDSKQYLAMANDWINLNEFEKAIIFYEKCLQNDPNDLSALTNLSTCYAQLGKYESAIAGYRAVLAKNPDDPIVIENLIAMSKAIETQHSNL
ncbi:TPA: tetratricopeptide repeat protein [bacterium]|mgnify:CR=1 FL=1|nr:tetratricopeptide repeat protein [bacterium]